jgi:hypothetical protein
MAPNTVLISLNGAVNRLNAGGKLWSGLLSEKQLC